MTTNQELISQICTAVKTSNNAELLRLLQSTNPALIFNSKHHQAKNNPLYLVNLALETNNDDTDVLDTLFNTFGSKILDQDTTRLFKGLAHDSRISDSKLKTAKCLHIIDKYVGKALISTTDTALATNIARLAIKEDNRDLLEKCLANPSLKAAIESSPQNKAWLKATALLQDTKLLQDAKHSPTDCPTFVSTITGSCTETEREKDSAKPDVTPANDIEVRVSLQILERAIFNDLLKSSPKEHCNAALKAAVNARSQCQSQKPLCIEEVGKILKRALAQIEDLDCELKPTTMADHPCLSVTSTGRTSALDSTRDFLSVHDTTSGDDECPTLTTPSCTVVDNDLCSSSLTNVIGALTMFYDQLTTTA